MSERAHDRLQPLAAFDARGVRGVLTDLERAREAHERQLHLRLARRHGVERADGDHGDDGGDADDDAEQRQKGTQRVAAHRAQGEPDRLEKHQAASSAAESEAMRPSQNSVVRSA